MSDLQDLQLPIDRALFAEVLNSIPNTWTQATLIASIKSANESTMQLSIHIDPMKQPGIATLTDELQDKVHALFMLHKQHNTGLKGVEYTYKRRPDGKWSFEAEFEYE